MSVVGIVSGRVNLIQIPPSAHGSSRNCERESEFNTNTRTNPDSHAHTETNRYQTYLDFIASCGEREGFEVSDTLGETVF